ncbi:MAG: hypothetical protein ACOX6S_06490 [Clostridia bacterium]
MLRVSYYDFLINCKSEAEHRLKNLYAQLDILEGQDKQSRENILHKINRCEKILDSIETALADQSPADSL